MTLTAAERLVWAAAFAGHYRSRASHGASRRSAAKAAVAAAHAVQGLRAAAARLGAARRRDDVAMDTLEAFCHEDR